MEGPNDFFFIRRSSLEHSLGLRLGPNEDTARQLNRLLEQVAPVVGPPKRDARRCDHA